MKARKRVVTSGRGTPTGKRTPTVRRIRPAIVPARPRAPGRSQGAALPPQSARADTADGSDAAALDLAVDLGHGLVLASPIVAASGPFGYGVEVTDEVDIGRLGAVVTRGTSLRPRAGAAPPRMIGTPAGLLHDVGRQNPGIEIVLERHEPTWRTWRTPVILNVWGESVGEIVELVRRLEGAAGVAAIELDLASPNGGGRSASPFGEDEAAAASLTAAVRRAWDGPLIVKLIAVPEVRAVARAVASAGADAISAIGAVSGLAVAPDRRTTVPAGAFGGLSGPAIRPIAMRAVRDIASAVRVPVIGLGGVSTLDDALDLLAVGAVAVGVGVAALADPRLPSRLADELAAECRRRGLTGYASLVGTARRT